MFLVPVSVSTSELNIFNPNSSYEKKILGLQCITGTVFRLTQLSTPANLLYMRPSVTIKLHLTRAAIEMHRVHYN